MTTSIPVRTGPFQYVLVRADGSTSTISIDESAIEAGRFDVSVAEDDRILEIALSSTSDPDLDPPRGQLWP
jgi:hypothetical protein